MLSAILDASHYQKSWKWPDTTQSMNIHNKLLKWNSSSFDIYIYSSDFKWHVLQNTKWHFHQNSSIFKYHFTWEFTTCTDFLKFFGGHISFLWDHWYPCFGLLVMFPLGFKARVGALFSLGKGMHDVHSLRFTCGVTPANLLVVSMAASHFLHMQVLAVSAPAYCSDVLTTQSPMTGYWLENS